MAKSLVKKSLEIGFKVLLIAVAGYFIYSRLQGSDYKGVFSYRWHFPLFYSFSFIALWAFNLFLDAVIWKSVNRFVGHISIKRAFKTNFVSYALAFITPANSGEVAGRYIMLHNNHDRKKTLFLIFWSHFPRVIIKLLLGVSSLLILGGLSDNVPWPLVFAGLAIGISALLSFYFLFIRIQRWLHGRNLLKLNFSKYILNDRPYFTEKVKLSLLALVKYITYNTQFLVLLLMWGNMELTPELALSIIVFYFITSIIPTYAAFDFVIKAALAMYVFQFTMADESLLINASFIIWVFNIALPALAGVVIILRSNLTHSIKRRFSRGNLYGP